MTVTYCKTSFDNSVPDFRTEYRVFSAVPCPTVSLTALSPVAGLAEVPADQPPGPPHHGAGARPHHDPVLPQPAQRARLQTAGKSADKAHQR